jgi:hypothetical protein
MVNQIGQQDLVFSQIAVHLPIADDQWLSHAATFFISAKLANYWRQLARGISCGHGV